MKKLMISLTILASVAFAADKTVFYIISYESYFTLV